MAQDGTDEGGHYVTETEQYSLVLRAVWFLLVGWWASGVWLSVAWLLNVTVVGIPLGIKMINLVPFVISLRRRADRQIVSFDGEAIQVTEQSPEQVNLLVRGVYFVLVGWWLSLVWMGLAWLASITIVGLPVAIWMYNRLPFVVSLYKLG